MKKIVFLLMILTVVAFRGMAQTVDEKRRIEEERRQSLIPGEMTGFEQKGDAFVKPVFDRQVFFSDLFSREGVLLSDACQAFVILLGMENKMEGLNSQWEYLTGKGILSKDIFTEGDLNRPLRKGEVAYMLCKVLGVRGGIAMRLFGGTQRYAFKEMVYHEIMLPGYAQDFISGQEFVYAFKQAVDFMAEREEVSR